MPAAAALLLLRAASAATAVLPDDLPPGFALDGDLSEWTRPPDLVLGPDQLLSGEGGDASDFSARVWWSVQLDGLVLAVDVRDDVVLLPSADDDPLLADHVSLWISLPPAELPPIGFASEQGQSVLKGPADCVPLGGDAEACRAWFAAQPPRRARLSRLFLRQYTFTPDGVTETWGGLCVPAPIERPERGHAACRSSQVALRQGEGGYRVEARVALTDFPATHDNLMTHLRLLVEAVDNDVGRDGQEVAYTSDPNADPNRPSTLPRYDLLRPPLLDSDPPLFAAVELHDPDPGLFYFPALKLAAAYTFENLALAGQRTPTLPSPQVTALDWTRPRRLAGVGDVIVYEIPASRAGCAGCAVGRRLALARGDQVFALDELGLGSVKGFGLRGEALHLIVAESGPMDPLDPRSPREHTVRALTVSKGGEIEEVFSDALVEGEPEDGLVYSGISVQVTPDGSAFGFVGKRAAEETPEQAHSFSRIHQVNVATGEYVAGEDQM